MILVAVKLENTHNKTYNDSFAKWLLLQGDRGDPGPPGMPVSSQWALHMLFVLKIFQFFLLSTVKRYWGFSLPALNSKIPE